MCRRRRRARASPASATASSLVRALSDDERVLVLVHLIGRGRTSGAELGHMQAQASGASLFQILDGKSSGESST